MALNTGTLISSAIRPVDSLDTIATAYASEIKGGLHSYATLSERDSIIFERREWGMMVNVYSDVTPSNNKTYQLSYNYVSTNIMDNTNWKEFSGGSGGGVVNEWIDSVLSISNFEPVASSGDRYLLGNAPSGVNWSSFQSDKVVEWNSVTNQWTQTTPTDGMSVRVDDEDNSIYRYEGVFPIGAWVKEKLNQIRSIVATTVNGLSYSVTMSPPIDQYYPDMLFLTQFAIPNVGSTVSLNINGLGEILVKRPSASGLSNFKPNEIDTTLIYNVCFDGTYFQLSRPYTNDDIFSVKYLVEPSDYIVVPPYYQYWVYSDLTIQGTLVNYGQVVIANGSMILSGGTFSNYGQLSLVNFATGMTSSFNDSNTISFSQSNTIYGLSVSAEVKNSSINTFKLDSGSNGGATAGYILSVDSMGYFQWIPNSGLAQPEYSQINLSPLNTSTGLNFQPTGLTISYTPNDYSRLSVYVNGQLQNLGDGQNSTASVVDCYFSNDGGVTARTISSVDLGDELYWNGFNSGFNLISLDSIDMIYSRI
jgi:hypothetical protein